MGLTVKLLRHRLFPHSGLRLGRINAILNGINYDENQVAAIRSVQSAALMTISNYNSVLIIYKHGADLWGILPVCLFIPGEKVLQDCVRM